MRISDYLKDPNAAEAAFRAYAEGLPDDFVVELEYNRTISDETLRETIRKRCGFSEWEWKTLGETERRMNILAYLAPDHCVW